MASRNSKSRFRHPIAPLILASSLVGGVSACSLTSDPPAVTQVPPTISAQAPEAAVQGSESIAFYYDGVKTSVTVKDAAILFAACTLNTSDTTKIVGFVNNTLKAGPIQASDVTGLGDPLKPAISDFTGDGTVDCKDAAVLFAVATLGTEAPAAKVNGFLSGTLKLPEVNVTQTQLDTLFKTPATPTPTPTLTPTPTPTLTPTPTPTPTLTVTPTPTPMPDMTWQLEAKLQEANKAFRDAVASEMQVAARQAGVKIHTDNFVAIPLDDGSSVVVNAGIAGVENLTLEQLAQGADVLFTFLRLPQGSPLPSGFYTVRFFQTPGTTQWKAQFRNLDGRVALETDAQVGPGDPAQIEIPKPKLTGGVFIDPRNPITGSRIEIDIHWKKGKAQASVRLGTGGPDPSPLPAAGQVIAQATANFYQAARGIINTIKINSYRQVIIGSRDDNLVVHTVFQGVEELTLDELAKGQDVFFGYFRTPQSSGLPSGFYTVRIARSATGEWLARFVDAKGNTVKEGPATVGRGEPLAQRSPRLTIDIGLGSMCIDFHFGPIVIKVCRDLISDL